jgi:hypothetical protein
MICLVSLERLLGELEEWVGGEGGGFK